MPNKPDERVLECCAEPITKFRTTVPPDHDTVLGYLAVEEPHVLRMMVDPLRSLFDDQCRAMRLSHAYGASYFPVDTPLALIEAGLPEGVVYAFPVAILREVFPANP